MFGFAAHRRDQLDAELRRMSEELPKLGVQRAYLTGGFAQGAVDHETSLDLVLVHETAEPYHRRADFFTTHLRPRVGANFAVYTPAEFDRYEHDDPLLIAAIRSGPTRNDA